MPATECFLLKFIQPVLSKRSLHRTAFTHHANKLVPLFLIILSMHIPNNKAGCHYSCAANAKIIIQIAGINGNSHTCLEQRMHMHIQMHRHIVCVATLNCILLKKYLLKIVMREVTMLQSMTCGSMILILVMSNLSVAVMQQLSFHSQV